MFTFSKVSIASTAIVHSAIDNVVIGLKMDCDYSKYYDDGLNYNSNDEDGYANDNNMDDFWVNNAGSGSGGFEDYQEDSPAEEEKKIDKVDNVVIGLKMQADKQSDSQDDQNRMTAKEKQNLPEEDLKIDEDCDAKEKRTEVERSLVDIWEQKSKYGVKEETKEKLEKQLWKIHQKDDSFVKLKLKYCFIKRAFNKLKKKSLLDSDKEDEEPYKLEIMGQLLEVYKEDDHKNIDKITQTDIDKFCERYGVARYEQKQEIKEQLKAHGVQPKRKYPSLLELKQMWEPFAQIMKQLLALGVAEENMQSKSLWGLGDMLEKLRLQLIDELFFKMKIENEKTSKRYTRDELDKMSNEELVAIKASRNKKALEKEISEKEALEKEISEKEGLKEEILGKEGLEKEISEKERLEKEIEEDFTNDRAGSFYGPVLTDAWSEKKKSLTFDQLAVFKARMDWQALSRCLRFSWKDLHEKMKGLSPENVGVLFRLWNKVKDDYSMWEASFVKTKNVEILSEVLNENEQKLIAEIVAKAGSPWREGSNSGYEIDSDSGSDDEYAN